MSSSDSGILEDSERSFSRPRLGVSQDGAGGDVVAVVVVGTGWVGDWKRRGAEAVRAWLLGACGSEWSPCVWCRQGDSRLRCMLDIRGLV